MRGRARHALGLIALVLLCVMGAILEFVVKPQAALAPQMELRPYTEPQLVAFVASLPSPKDLVGTYRVVLVYLDTAFVACFALWAGMSLVAWRRKVLAGLGFACIAAVIGLDAWENLRLLAAVAGEGRIPREMVLVDPPQSLTSQITQAKLLAYIATMAVLGLGLIMRWRKRQ